MVKVENPKNEGKEKPKVRKKMALISEMMPRFIYKEVKNYAF